MRASGLHNFAGSVAQSGSSKRIAPCAEAPVHLPFDPRVFGKRCDCERPLRRQLCDTAKFSEDRVVRVLGQAAEFENEGLGSFQDGVNCDPSSA